jgi:myosin I
LFLVLEYPSHLFNIAKDSLKIKLTSRTIETRTATQQERIDVTLNVEQAEYTRDALAKGIYSRLFDYLVMVIGYFILLSPFCTLFIFFKTEF